MENPIPTEKKKITLFFKQHTYTLEVWEDTSSSSLPLDYLILPQNL